MSICPRCQKPTTGRGRTGMCSSCASHFVGKKVMPKIRSNQSEKLRERSIQPDKQIERFNARSNRPEPSMPKFNFLEREAEE